MTKSITFNLDKMTTQLEDAKPLYRLLTSEGEILMNDLIGQDFRIYSHKEINCCHCGKKTAKSYSGGYCYPCSLKLAEVAHAAKED